MSVIGRSELDLPHNSAMRVWMSSGCLGRSVLGGGQDRDEPLGVEGKRVFGHAVQVIADRW
jgi:hypothetical protein